MTFLTARAASLLEGLSSTQVRAVTVDAAPLCILAGAGSGKTRVLTRRIAWRIAQAEADADHVLAVTFTRKAAGELRDRLRSLGLREAVAAGTFHALAYAQLRRRYADAGEVLPQLLDRKLGLLAAVLPRRLAVPGQRGPGARGADTRTALLADLAAEIEWAKARLVPPARYAEESARAARRPPLPPEDVARVYTAYEAEKRHRQVMDFDDLLSLCAHALEEDPAFAAAQRWRFRHIFVDEFQDVNPSQARLLARWVDERTDLCVVGDPNQSIYAWNGADSTVLTRFEQSHPGATVVRLDDNWRSSPQILAAARAVLASGGRAPDIRSRRSDGPEPTILAYGDDEAEARGIARRLRAIHSSGRTWSSFAVLTRTNAQLVPIQEALGRAEVPFRTAAGASLLDQPEIRAIVRDLRRGPGRPLAEIFADLDDHADRATGGGATSGGADDRRLHILALGRLASEFASLDALATVAAFLAWLPTAVRSERTDNGDDAVELTTFHRAKGLEWPVVFLAGLEQGLVPIAQATTAAAEAEERRLLYVALTRAETELHCSWAQRRTIGRRALRREPSPWLLAIEDSIAASARSLDGASNIRQLGGARRELDGRPSARGSGRASTRRRPADALGDGADPEVVGALRAWRAQTAKVSGVPAYVVLHDSTLAALAARRPLTPKELLEVPGMGPVKAGRYGEDLLALLSPAPPTSPSSP